MNTIKILSVTFGIIVVLTGCSALQLTGKPCGHDNLALCVSTTEGEVRRVIDLRQGEPVSLETNVDEIKMRGRSRGRDWSLIESPTFSLEASGHPVDPSSRSKIRVTLHASLTSSGVDLLMTVHEGMNETAQFVTHFGHGAVIEKTPTGGVAIVVDLPANARTGLRPVQANTPNHPNYSLDQVFILLRRSIGNEIEAREWPLHIDRPASLVSDSVESHPIYENETFAAGCAGKVVRAATQAISFEGDFGWPLWGAIFTASGHAEPLAQLSLKDRVVCRDHEVWIVSYAVRRPEVRIRRYSNDGHLQRFVDTTIPPAQTDQLEYDFVDPASLREENGRIYFERAVLALSGGGTKYHEIKRELFELKL